MLRRAIIVNSESFGKGNEELGKKLMGVFLKKLWASDNKPEWIIFYNSGVKLLAVGSDVIDALDALFTAGVDLLACGTCITFYGLDDKLKIGRISNMDEIVAVLMKAENVITV